MTVRYGDHRPAYTLEFLGADFDAGCRLWVEDAPIAEGATRKCVDALAECVDPYSYPFTLKTAAGVSSVIVLRAAAQRAAGESCRVNMEEVA